RPAQGLEHGRRVRPGNLRQIAGAHGAAADGAALALDHLGCGEAQVRPARNGQAVTSVCGGRQAAHGADVKACCHKPAFYPPSIRPATALATCRPYGSAVRMPAGPPLVLMEPTFCSARPLKPATTISSSTMHCASTVRLLEDQAMPWHHRPIGISAV